jgi:hypothetical protein
LNLRGAILKTKKKQETDKLNRQKLIKDITEILANKLDNGTPISDKNIKIAYQQFVAQYPEAIRYDVWMNLCTANKKPEAIADSIIKIASEKTKIKQIRERVSYKHPGPPKNKEWALFTNADDILMGKTKQEMHKIIGNLSDYEELKDKMIRVMVYDQFNIIKDITPRWNRQAIDKMLDEIKTLIKVRSIFIEELSKAISKEGKNKKQNISFLKKAIYLFKIIIGNGLIDILNTYITINPQGKPINSVTLANAIKNTRAYSKGEESKKTSTFYDRDKMTFLCYLAANIELYFRQPIERIEREVAVLRAKKAIKDLAEYYFIRLDELIPQQPFSLITTPSLLGSTDFKKLQSSRKPAPQKINRTDSNLLLEILERFKSLRKSLKDELSVIIADLDKS